MSYAADAMLALHTMFRREFGLLPALVRAVAAGDTPRATLVADHIALLIAVLSLHYRGENRHIWPRLRERCPERFASLAAALDSLYHAGQSCLRRVSEAVGAWRDSASAYTRDVLARAIGRLIRVTAERTAFEEDRVVPLVDKHITEAEYAAKVRENAASVPRDTLPVLFGMAMYDGDPVVIGMFVADMPVEVQPYIMDISVRAYAAYAAELYWPATPPSPSASGRAR